jgi:hypothetical protein
LKVGRGEEKKLRINSFQRLYSKKNMVYGTPMGYYAGVD